STATVTIHETDQPTTIQFSQANYTGSEKDPSVVINVNRAGGLPAATVDFATADGTAKAGSNYVATSGTLTFAKGQTSAARTAVAGANYVATSGTLSFGTGQSSATFTVQLIDDGTFRTDNLFLNLTLSNATGSSVLGSQSTATLTIAEADGTPNQLFVAKAYE